MADIRPFCACRPAAGLEKEIAALPYDVYSRKEARAYVEKHPGSFLAIDRAETTLPADLDIYDRRVYEHASEMLHSWIRQGRFIQDPAPCYYVYEQTMGGRTQTGIAACASIDDYDTGVIKKHENTRAEKEQDRINHVDTCSAQTGPIFLCYRQNSTIEEVVKKITAQDPVYDFDSDGGVRNRVWIISDPIDCDVIRTAFAGIDSIYIADGHHRCASAVRVGKMRREQNPGYTGQEDFNYFLSILFPENELKIMDYNRTVLDLNGLSVQDFLKKAEESFEIIRLEDGSKAPLPACKGELGMYLDGRWYLLKIRPECKSDDPVAGLDVSILQDRLLAPVLGIGDPKTDSRIEFVGGIRGTKELEVRADNHNGVSFLMHPTSLQELFAVADAGRLMPPKSTWFEPKLLSGLFIHLI